VRLFFALWPPQPAAGALHEWAARAARLAGGRVTRADTVHLTLAFLGETDESRLARARQAARGVSGAPHSLPIEQARYWKHNRIVWAGPNEIPAPLAALAVDLKNNLEREGFSLESRAFAAHVTLIRQAREPGAALPQLPGVDWPVEEFVLVRSVPSREGSSYETIERFALDQK
jgi:2'-5' RNA ligase